LQTIFLGWLQTLILLISASWKAKITGVSHQQPAFFTILYSQTGSPFPGSKSNLIYFIVLFTCPLINYATNLLWKENWNVQINMAPCYKSCTLRAFGIFIDNL
jgi:hypothetical protein